MPIKKIKKAWETRKIKKWAKKTVTGWSKEADERFRKERLKASKPLTGKQKVLKASKQGIAYGGPTVGSIGITYYGVSAEREIKKKSSKRKKRKKRK